MRTERVPEIWRQVSVGAVFETPSRRLVRVTCIHSFGRVDTTERMVFGAFPSGWASEFQSPALNRTDDYYFGFSLMSSEPQTHQGDPMTKNATETDDTETETNPNAEYAAIEANAHLRAKEVAVAVFGENPTFETVNEVRKRSIFMDDDGELFEIDIEDAQDELKFAIGWLADLGYDKPSVADVLRAFDVLDCSTLDEKLADIADSIDSLGGKKRK